MKKIYVLDTNVLLSDPNAIHSFDNNDVVIPSVVLQELDSKKKQMDEVGRNARYVSRQFDKLREKGKLHKGVKLDSGGILKVVASPKESHAYDSFIDNSVDTAIIAVADMLQSQNITKKVVMVSKDVLVRVKSDMFVQSEDYYNDKVITTKEDRYSGYTELEIDDEDIDMFYENKKLKSPMEVQENHFIILKSNQTNKKTALTKYKKGYLYPLYNYNEDEVVWGINAKNMQQKLALDLLLDENIPLITISGKAGTGKTLLALAAGLQQIEETQRYKKMLVARPVVPMGKDIGYLPGEKEEKLRPWMQPIYDNLEFLFDCKNPHDLDRILMGMGSIQVEALTYIRGRSIPDQFIIIDEAQNLTQHEVKTILTRVGEGSKIILMGDPDQIDHPYLDAYSNGLTYVIEKLKDLKESGHVTLERGERSTLAQLCADML